MSEEKKSSFCFVVSCEHGGRMVTYILLWSEKQLGPVLCKRISECSLNSLDACPRNDVTNSCLIEAPLTLFFCRLLVCLLISCCNGALLTAGPKDPSRLQFSNSFCPQKFSHCSSPCSSLGTWPTLYKALKKLSPGSSKQSASELAELFLGVPGTH